MYRAAVIAGWGHLFNEVPDYEAIQLPYSHAAGYFAEEKPCRMCGSASRRNGAFWEPI